MAENKHLLTLEGGAYSYEVGFDREYKTLFIMGAAETSAPNIIAVRVLSLGFRWPPWRYVSCFTPHPDYEVGKGETL